MKRRFDVSITDLDGLPVTLGEGRMQGLVNLLVNIRSMVDENIQAKIDSGLKTLSEEGLTLKSASISALLAAYNDESTLTDQDRLTRMELARKIHAAKEGEPIDVKAEDLGTLKKLIAKRYGGVLIPVVAGELLEQDPTS